MFVKITNQRILQIVKSLCLICWKWVIPKKSNQCFGFNRRIRLTLFAIALIGASVIVESVTHCNGNNNKMKNPEVVGLNKNKLSKPSGEVINLNWTLIQPWRHGEQLPRVYSFYFLRKRHGELVSTPLRKIEKYNGHCYLDVENTNYKCSLVIKDLSPMDSGSYSSVANVIRKIGVSRDEVETIRSNQTYILEVSQNVQEISLKQQCRNVSKPHLALNVTTEMECTASGSSQSVELEWQFDGNKTQVVESEQQSYLDISRGTYTTVSLIKVISHDANANLTCRAASRKFIQTGEFHMIRESKPDQASRRVIRSHTRHACSHSIATGRSGKISVWSSRYRPIPQRTSAGVLCSWEISVAAGSVVKLKFIKLRLRHYNLRSDCSAINKCGCCDTLNIVDVGDNNLLLGSYCLWKGSSRAFHSNSNHVKLELHGIIIPPRFGFKMTWEAVERPAFTPIILERQDCGKTEHTRIMINRRRKRPRGRIFGGRKSWAWSWPWHVMIGIYMSEEYWCGGTLIHPRWVLTAAHCLTECLPGPKNIIVILRMFHLRYRDFSLRHEVSKIIHYPNFNKKTYSHDIVLLKLTMPAHISQLVKQVCLPDKDDLKGKTKARAIGWGRTGNRRYSPHLLQVDLPVLDVNECKSRWQQENTNQRVYTNNQLCTLDKTGKKDTCQGDSGGSLLIFKNNRWVIIGITSWGPVNCSSKTLPAVYVRVAHYMPWIAKTLEAESGDVVTTAIKQVSRPRYRRMLAETVTMPTKVSTCKPHSSSLVKKSSCCNTPFTSYCWKSLGLYIVNIQKEKDVVLGKQLSLSCLLHVPPPQKFPEILHLDIGQGVLISWHFVKKGGKMFQSYWAPGYNDLHNISNNHEIYIKVLNETMLKSVLNLRNFTQEMVGDYFCTAAVGITSKYGFDNVLITSHQSLPVHVTDGLTDGLMD